MLEIRTDVSLAAGDPRELWFRFGIDDGSQAGDPAASMRALSDRLPRANADQAGAEVPWRAALLAGGASRDEVIGAHTLDQSRAYSMVIGFNGASRDPLQHALPQVYSEPGVVLRNTCASASADGALDCAKRPYAKTWKPCDGDLYALWLAAEYSAATGDLQAFDAPPAYHPAYHEPAIPLRLCLQSQLGFLVDNVGRSPQGHVRMRNADWNDMAIEDSCVPRDLMIREGESVPSSAPAAWVLPVFAGLAARLGDAALAGEAQRIAAELREAVARAWNGRWFDRAFARGGHAVGGPEDMWLEVQPWAPLCGAADDSQAEELLAAINEGPRANSPPGARVRWPVPDEGSMMGARGEGTGGGRIWHAVNMTLIWAAARNDQETAWDELRRISLDSHAKAYPGIWEGTLSGADSYNAPESPRPGRTWTMRPFGGMQAFPVNNLHSHLQPLLSYLRLADAARQPADRLGRRMAQQHIPCRRGRAWPAAGAEAGRAGDRSPRGRRHARTRPLVARTATQ